MSIPTRINRDLPAEVELEYTERLTQHIEAVQEAGRKLSVPETQLSIHDDSKWSDAEFGPYALHFCGGGAPKLFAPAWLHHIHNNPHHWQYWIFPDGYTLEGSGVEPGGVLRMPNRFALEMVADWMGASKTYTGSWDMTAWLTENIPGIVLHSETAEFVQNVLRKSLGYEGLPPFDTGPTACRDAARRFVPRLRRRGVAGGRGKWYTCE